ncbi:MAG: hypothetical protein ACK5IC_06165 [Moheibacter sp.]
MEQLTLIIRFKNKAMTPKEYVAFSKEILLKLEDFNPIFKNLFGWGHEANAKSHFKQDKSDFEEIVFKQIEEKDITYINKEVQDKEMHWDSYSWANYGNSYSNTTKQDEKVSVSINCGSSEKEVGSFIIEFPQNNYPEFYDKNFVTRLLEYCMIFFSEIFYATVIGDKFRSKVRITNYSFWIGWINFLPYEIIYGLLPENIEKLKIKNGTLFSISKTVITEDDEHIITEAIEIRDMLGAKGFLNYKK